jgi:hypothetical protein
MPEPVFDADGIRLFVGDAGMRRLAEARRAGSEQGVMFDD